MTTTKTRAGASILSALRSDEPTELTYGGHLGFTHGWWLDGGSLGLGISLTREVGTPMWPNRVMVTLEVGPLTWHLSREWDYKEEG